MATKTPKIIALIPARGSSKSIPKKNLTDLGGYPLLAFAIVASKLAKHISRVIVTTESEEIAELAKSYGAEAPFIEPVGPGHGQGDRHFVTHALNWFKEHEGAAPDYLTLIRPTTPLREPEMLDRAIEALLADKEATALRSAHELAEPIQKMMRVGEDGYLCGFFPEDPRPEYYNLPRQTFPPTYHPNGYIDILVSSYLLKDEANDRVYGPMVLPFKTKNPGEIDGPDDLAFVKFMLAHHDWKIYDYLEEHFKTAAS